MVPIPPIEGTIQVCVCVCSHSIHRYIYLHENPQRSTIHVGKNTIPMDGMGIGCNWPQLFDSFPKIKNCSWKKNTHTDTFHMLFFCSWKLCAELAPPKNKNHTRAMCWVLEWEGVTFLFWTCRSELNILGKSLNITQEQKGLKPTKHGNEVSHMYLVTQNDWTQSTWIQKYQ